jgi:hypothetical protein
MKKMMPRAVSAIGIAALIAWSSWEIYQHPAVVPASLKHIWHPFLHTALDSFFEAVGHALHP